MGLAKTSSPPRNAQSNPCNLQVSPSAAVRRRRERADEQRQAGRTILFSSARDRPQGPVRVARDGRRVLSKSGVSVAKLSMTTLKF
jgi:hypothetical protein